MTSQIIQKTPDALVGDDLSAVGYSDKEISLIGYCWQDAEAINKDKTSLAMHLWELKQEMDASGSQSAGGNGGGSTKSRFWAAFDSGHLPYTGDTGRTTVKTCLSAANFLTEIEADREVKDLTSRLRNLAPATLYEISNLENDAQNLVFKSVESCDFIGVAAVRLIAHEAEQDVFKKLFAWIEDHPSTAITPKTIRALQAEVAVENTPAKEQVINANTAERQEAAFNRIMAEARERAPEVAAQNRVNAVREELERPSFEQRQKLEGEIRKYNSKLNAAAAELDELLSYLKSIDRIHGTVLLDELRADSVNGLISVENDLDRIRSMGNQLMQIVELASSHTTASGIDMTTLDIDQL